MGGIISRKPFSNNYIVPKIKNTQVAASATLDSKEIEVIKKSIPGILIEEDSSTEFRAFCEICQTIRYNENLHPIIEENNNSILNLSEKLHLLPLPYNISFLIVLAGELVVYFHCKKRKINHLATVFKAGDFVHFFVNDLIGEDGEIVGENEFCLYFFVRSVCSNTKIKVVGSTIHDLNKYFKTRPALVSIKEIFSIDLRQFIQNREFRGLKADQV